MRRWLTRMALAVCTSLVVLFPARAQEVPADPVEVLRETLAQVGTQSGAAEDAVVLKYRAAFVREKVAALNTVGQMRQALMLGEWKDQDRINTKLAAVDAAARTALAERFAKELAKAAKASDEPTRLAVVFVLGSLGDVRAVDPANTSGMGRNMTPVVVPLCADKSPAVRAAAAQALASMRPEPVAAALILKALLQDKEAQVRQAAASGLVTLVVASHSLAKNGRSQNGIQADREDVLIAAKAVVEVADPGAGSVEVRRLCMLALKAAAIALNQMVYDPFEEFVAARAGAPLAPIQAKHLVIAQETLALERKLLLPLIDALKQQSKALLAGLQDADPAVVQAAAGVVEELAVANQRLRAREASVPPSEPPDHFGNELRAPVPLLAKKLPHPSVDVKLAVLYALETLERDASPAAAAVAKALDDANPFVRWGAARTLGRMAGFKGPDVAVAVTALGKHLTDDSARVRTAAVVALARYGPAAKGALKELTGTLETGDPALRQQAMQVLVVIGPDAKPAVPALAEALTAKEKPVRLAAARTLAALGSSAGAALPALHRAMEDADADVRLAAAAAVLAIGAPGK